MCVIIACNSVLNAIDFLDLLYVLQVIHGVMTRYFTGYTPIYGRKPVLHVQIHDRHRSGILYILTYLEYIGKNWPSQYM